MGGVAAIARQAGFRVTGCDAGVYPPMSEQLQRLGIDLVEGFGAEQLSLNPDCWVIGNVVSRGNPLMEAILDSGQRYVSGPQWLYENALAGRRVLAIAGTHGKTTTTAMLRHILLTCGVDTGWLVGGVPADGAPSASLGTDSRFVIEADEYDTAFFDKRSKFVHYHPSVAVLNNLEFDHADIFPDLASIQTQFHHLVRTIPSSGCIIRPQQSDAIDEVLSRGAWSPVQTFGPQGQWSATDLAESTAHSSFTVCHQEREQGRVDLAMPGAHNRLNALASIAAAVASGVAAPAAAQALNSFAGVRRRLELRGEVDGVAIIDDFAHHPTAIAMTIAGQRERMRGRGRILAVLEPRSNTMRAGVMNERLADSLAQADHVFCFDGAVDWDARGVLAPLAARLTVSDSVDRLVSAIAQQATAGDAVLVMSNGGFGGIHQKLLDALRARAGIG